MCVPAERARAPRRSAPPAPKNTDQPAVPVNALNSLSSLPLSQRTDGAERMIMNPSTFVWTTLSAGPTADIANSSG